MGSPIIIDTKAQGFHLTTLSDGVEFEMSPGQPMQVSWTDGTYMNGFLALDRNGNGRIDNGSELFGSFTAQPASDHRNGFAALRVFDDPANGGNGNGKIDPGDAVYSSLLLWIDQNHNGVSEPSELFSLSEAGIFAIDLTYSENSYFDQSGNLFRYRASISDRNGPADPTCYDVFLQLKAIDAAR